MDENNNVVVRVPEQQFVRGEDGYSPVVTIEEIEHGHSVNITDREHPEGQSFDVLDGTDGEDGKDGEDGEDGVSPTIAVTDITGGHRLTITDRDHPSGESVDVMDGEDGTAGTDGVTYTPSVDAAGNISWTNDGDLPNPQTRNIKGPTGDKLTYADLTAADKADLVQGPIAEAQTAAVAAVNQAGTTQVSAVNTAGATQVQAVEGKGAEVLESIPSDYSDLTEDVSDIKSAKAPVIIDTASGTIASFEDGAGGMPLKSLTVSIDPAQAGSGDPSPTNPRPLIGRTECNVVVSPTQIAADGTTTVYTFPTPPGTVYGGTLNASDRQLSVEWKRVSFPASGDGWTFINGGRTGDGRRYYANIAVDASGGDRPFVRVTPDAGDNNGLCNVYPWVLSSQYESGADGRAYADSAGGEKIHVILRSDNNPLSNKNDVMTLLQTLPYTIEVAYRLAVPIVYQITSLEVPTLFSGTNNIWADCGDVTVEYPIDTKLYTDAMDDQISQNAANISDLQSAVIDTLTLDFTDKRSAYVNTVIGAQVSFESSSASFSFNKIIYVKAFKTYTIAVRNGTTVAYDGIRKCIVADNNDVVRNVFSIQTTANAINTIDITPTVDGYLVLTVDKNYLDISITVNYAKSAENEIRLVEGVKNQNLIRLTDKTVTHNGVTYQFNAEQGTVSTSGTSTSSWSKATIWGFTPDETASYYIAGCPAGGSNTSAAGMKYQIGVYDNASKSDAGFDGGNGITLTLVAGHYYTFYIAFGNTKNADGKVFTPILIKSSSAVNFRPHQITLKELKENAPVSILDLGGKNDGTMDIGPIINRNTDSMAIYLPIGKYLVTTPIKLTHSLLGVNSIECFSSTAIPEKIATTLISGLDSGDIIKTTGTSGAVTISDINIVCNGNESAINVGSNTRVRISNVSIYHLGDAKGIYASYRFSANAYLNNVYIYADKNKESVGIDFTNTVDCRIADTTILYCQVGVKLNGMHYLSNVHIWTGSNSNITKEWYDNTVCIYGGTSALIFGTNVYVDSAYNLLYFKAGARMWMTNLMSWDDGTGSAHENSIHLTQKEGTAYLYVNGGCYNNSGRITPGTDATNQLVNFIGV